VKRVVAAAAVVAAVLPVAAYGSGAARPSARDTRSAAARAATWAERYRAVAEHVPALRPFADGAEAAASTVRATDTFDFAFPLAMGDFDGDGGGDIADMRVHEEFDDTTGDYSVTVRVEAHRGRDGWSLWTVALPGVFPVMFPARLANGRAGMVVFSDDSVGTDALVAAGGVGDALVSAYDGAGKQMWSHTVPLAGVYTLTGGSGTGMYLGDVGDLNPGGGDDTLVEEFAGAGAGDPVTGEAGVSAGRVQVRVLDGATGTARDLGAPFVSDDILFPTIVGDVSGDRRPDVAVVVGTPDGRTLRTIRSSDGAEVWASAIGSGEPYVLRLPDMSGDDRAEVGLYQWSDADGTETFAVFDGASGKLLWRQESGDVVPLGDIDGRRGTEIAILRRAPGSGSSVGVRATAVTASGKTVWSTTRTVSTSGLTEPRVSHSLGDVGDVQPDGVRDLGYLVTALPLGAAGRRDEGTIDGRTGAYGATRCRRCAGRPARSTAGDRTRTNAPSAMASSP